MAYKTSRVVLVFLVLGLACSAQAPEPISAPDDLVLALRTSGDRRQFHLGEIVPVEYSYTAPPGRYLYVSRLDRLTGGRPVQVECVPAVQSTAEARAAAGGAAEIFQQMLVDPACQGAGAGGGIGSGCGDCDQELPLRRTPLVFGGGNLNAYVRWREPGTYSCRVTAAEATTAAREEKIRPALLAKSNWLKITITDDPAWAHTEALAYAAAYSRDCRGDDVPTRGFIECSDIATRLSHLDTAESVATEVRFFDGRNRGWDGFWDALVTTTHPGVALELMTRRMQDPDVQVSDFVLRWLAASSLKAADPDAFQATSAASHYAQAIEELRKYVRLLGTSLAGKHSDVLPESLKTYRTLAATQSCNGDPLIPDVERNAVLDAIGTLR